MIKNRIQDVKEYLKDAPVIKGMSEIHIFFEPIDPQPETVIKFEQICKQLNEKYGYKKGFMIKACHLSLDFRNQGYLRVMQSSRYISSDNQMSVIEACYAEANEMQNMFIQAFDAGEIKEHVNVIREKIEAGASESGVPETDDEAKKYSHYFEYHIKIMRKDENNMNPMSLHELNELKLLSENLTKKYSRPVPLSFVNNQFHQRYLNVRFDQSGNEVTNKKVAEIERSIDATDNFAWDKTIREYVWFDSLRALDKGWIDFDDGDKA